MKRLPSLHTLAPLLAVVLLVVGCSTPPKKTGGSPAPTTRVIKTVPAKKGGGYYKDDGPGDQIPANLDDLPDAEPREEALHRWANRPYVVLGKEYIPQTSLKSFRQQGIASWYGKKFHGQKTSTGEVYDMFAMTAAHPTLALPSYARVTHVASGRSVIVRVNDRGPFHADRVMDLSYAAAHKLGYIEQGSSEVIIETILPGSGTLPPPAVPAAPPRTSDELDTLAQKLSREEEKPATENLPNRGFFLQLGAFANAENAENLKSHLSRELEWLKEPMRIHTAADNIHRLHLGPYTSRASAEQVARQIQSSLGYAPAILHR